MERNKRLIAVCAAVLGVVSGISGWPVIQEPLQWTQDLVRCPDSVAVIEEAFYSTPSPPVCDKRCRLGPETVLQDECYYRDGACVQRVRDEDVALLYATCEPTSAPTGCNLSEAGLPMSLTVGYSCLQGVLFDPYNQTFSWKAKKLNLALLRDIISPSAIFTRCQINADATNPNVKITALKSPPSTAQGDVSNVTSPVDDVTVVVDDVRNSVEESSFPRWWRVTKPRFQIEFKLVVTEAELHPHWISLEDDHMIEVICRRMDATSLSMTSPKSTGGIVAPFAYGANGKSYTLEDMVVAVVCAVAVLVVLALLVCLIVGCRRRYRERERDYSNLLSRVEFVNRSAESNLPSFATFGDDSGAGDSEPATGSSNPYPHTRGFSIGTAAVSNDRYGMSSFDSPDTQNPNPNPGSGGAAKAPTMMMMTTISSSSGTPQSGRATGGNDESGSGSGGCDSACAATTTYEHPRPLVVRLPEMKGKASGGVGVDDEFDVRGGGVGSGGGGGDDEFDVRGGGFGSGGAGGDFGAGGGWAGGKDAEGWGWPGTTSI